MDYSYLGYTENSQIVKGRLSAASEQAAVDMLANAAGVVSGWLLSRTRLASFLVSVEGRLFG